MSVDTKDTEEVRALLVKLNELAKRGVGGEADNARSKLKSLLLKYDLDISDLDDLVESRREFPYGGTDVKQLLAQCIWDARPDAEITSSKKRLYAILTLSEYVEVKEKYAHYSKCYKKEREQFLSAFIKKNGIGTTPPEGYVAPDMSKEEQKKEAILMAAIANNEFLSLGERPTKMIEADGND